MNKKLFIFCFSMILVFFNYSILSKSIAKDYRFSCSEGDLTPPPPGSETLFQSAEPILGSLIVKGPGQLTLVNPETNDSITIENEERDNIKWSYQVELERIQVSIFIEGKTFTANLDFMLRGGMQNRCFSREDESIVKNEQLLMGGVPLKTVIFYTSVSDSSRTQSETQENAYFIGIVKIIERENSSQDTEEDANSFFSMVFFTDNIVKFPGEFPPLEKLRTTNMWFR